MATANGRWPTYKQAYLQMVAYRGIRSMVNQFLSKYDINSTQWIIMGMVGDEPGGLRVTDLASRMQVEGAFITNTVRGLTSAGYVAFAAHPTDNRARLLTLTKTGKELVNKIEPELSQHLKRLTGDIKEADLQRYFDTLQALVDNTK